jgi:hypothetical protein
VLEPGDTIRGPRGTVVEVLDNRVGARLAAMRGLRAIR